MYQALINAMEEKITACNRRTKRPPSYASPKRDGAMFEGRHRLHEPHP
jgi:hypothetical protein